jgi:hypothetical protein
MHGKTLLVAALGVNAAVIAFGPRRGDARVLTCEVARSRPSAGPRVERPGAPWEGRRLAPVPQPQLIVRDLLQRYP